MVIMKDYLSLIDNWVQNQYSKGYLVVWVIIGLTVIFIIFLTALLK